MQYILAKYIEGAKGHAGGRWERLSTVKASLPDLIKQGMGKAKKYQAKYAIHDARTNSRLVSITYDDNHEVTVCMSAATVIFLLHRRVHWRTVSNESEETMESSPDNDGRREAMRIYNGYLTNMSGLQKMSRSYPGLYKCRVCRLHFAHANGNRQWDCPRCKSSDVKVIR